MKKCLKGNKGFSLVELIVVVLIMAIIAVALAPQVLKWINNSRIATDIQTKDSLVSAMQTTVLTDEGVNAIAKGEGAVLTVGYDGTATLKMADGSDYSTADAEKKILYDQFCTYAAISSLNELKIKNKGAEIVITVDKDATTITSHYHYTDASAEEIVMDD